MSKSNKPLIDLRNTPAASRAWRVSNLYTIRDADGRLVSFGPNFPQRRFYNNLWYCNHVLKARKLGFSTLIEILNLDDLLFTTTGLSAGIIDYTIEDAESKLSMMVTAYEHLDDGDIHPLTYKLGALIKKAIKLESRATRKLQFSNGSRAQCSTSLRGSTPNRLHVSELGKTAVWAPIKAREIVNGAFNSMTPGNVRNIESTHEGGKVGEHYRLLQNCMRQDPATLSEIDSRFHFFPWFEDPRYVLPYHGQPIRPEILKYGDRLTREIGIKLTPAQLFWYDRKHLEQGHGMKKEFPSSPGEAFEAMAENAIYGKEMADLRAAGRICDFGQELSDPLFTFWDIGLSDYCSKWLIQQVGRHFLVLDWFETDGAGAGVHVDHIRRWEAKWGRPIAVNFLPHDANKRSPNDGKSFLQTLIEAGLANCRVVPRTPDVWIGIGHAREVLPHCWFNKTHCDTARIKDGEEFPSGIACLEGYQKHLNPAGTTIREMPKHDLFSHSADAFRTFGEARHLGMLEAAHSPQVKPRTIGGPRSRR